MSRHFLGVGLLVFMAGCGNPPPVAIKSSKTRAPASVDLKTVSEDLRKPYAEPDQLRFALDQLNAAGAKPAPLNNSVVNGLHAKLRLSNDDIAAIRKADFGTLDVHVLYQALFFRDAAATLQVNGRPAMEQAKAAVEWLVRHVALEDRAGPPDPPAMAAQRGRGTAVERIYVYVAICRALGLDTFAVGDPQAAGDPSKLWGVGIVEGGDVRLFDPRLGIALPGPDKQIATLAALAKDAAPLQPLLALGYDVTADRVKAARLFPAMAVTSLAPRWVLAEKYAPPGTRVSTNASTLLDQAGRLPISGWEPNAVGTPLHVLSEFLPESEGGTDRPLPSQPTRNRIYRESLVPWNQLPREFLDGLGPFGQQIAKVFYELAAFDRQAGFAEKMRREQKIEDAFREMMSTANESPTDPRMQVDIVRGLSAGIRSAGDDPGPTLQQELLRGEYSSATPAMGKLERRLLAIRNKTSFSTLGPAAREWADQARAAVAEFIQAQRGGDVAAAQRKLDLLAPDSKKVVEYVSWMAAGPAMARLTYLTALAKHDQAEAQIRGSNSTAAWTTAVQVWEAFLANHANAAEAPLARRLLADALEGAGKKEAAAAAYKHAAAAAKHPLDRVACNYLASIQ